MARAILRCQECTGLFFDCAVCPRCRRCPQCCAHRCPGCGEPPRGWCGLCRLCRGCCACPECPGCGDPVPEERALCEVCATHLTLCRACGGAVPDGAYCAECGADLQPGPPGREEDPDALDELWAQLCERIGLPPPETLPPPAEQWEKPGVPTGPARPRGPVAPCQEREEIPEEVSTAQAAEILGVSKDTVLGFKKAGLLEWRNLAPPSSSRPVFAFTRRTVVKLRTSYAVDQPVPSTVLGPPRRAAKGSPRYKHLHIGDD